MNPFEYLETVHKMRQAVIDLWIYLQAQTTLREVRYKNYVMPAFSLQSLHFNQMLWKATDQADNVSGRSSETLVSNHLSVPDEGGEKRFVEFLNSSVYSWNFLLSQGAYFMRSEKWEEGADTDLKIKFSWLHQ